MAGNEKTVCVVCFANYCRSPVAEVILNNSCNKNIKIISTGINPISKPGMDKRSQIYLRNNGYKFSLHTPRKLTQKVIDMSDLVFAVDPIVLMQINNLFPSSLKKIKLLTYKNPQIILNDPYKFTDQAYNEVMQNIEHICLNLEIGD